jgi:hypothetical protein
MFKNLFRILAKFRTKKKPWLGSGVAREGWGVETDRWLRT